MPGLKLSSYKITYWIIQSEIQKNAWELGLVQIVVLKTLRWIVPKHIEEFLALEMFINHLEEPVVPYLPERTL